MGNLHCEAYTGSEQAVSLSPERREIVRADAVDTAEGSIDALKWRGAKISPGSERRA